MTQLHDVMYAARYQIVRAHCPSRHGRSCTVGFERSVTSARMGGACVVWECGTMAPTHCCQDSSSLLKAELPSLPDEQRPVGERQISRPLESRLECRQKPVRVPEASLVRPPYEPGQRASRELGPPFGRER